MLQLLYELSEDKYEEAIHLLDISYKNKIIMNYEYEKIKNIIELFAFGINDEGLMKYENSDDYVKYQLNKILRMVNKSSN